MADAFNTQQFNAVLEILNLAGAPASVDGTPVWASSDETVLVVLPGPDGMSAVIPCVAPGTARITVTADADLGTGTMTITGVSDDINVTLDPSQQASIIRITLGAPVPKT